MLTPRALGALIIAAAITPAALATDRYFRDSFAVSPNGRYRIDAKSPDNAGPHPRPFASNFTYTLKDTSTGKVIWQRKQPMRRAKGEADAWPAEPAPIALFITDDAVVAARTSSDTLLLLDPRDGRRRAEVPILGAFGKQEHDSYVSMSTAGPIWSQSSDWFFLSVPGPRRPALYFVVRPYWHQRLIVDVASGTQAELGAFRAAACDADLATAPEPTRRLLVAVMEEETRRALSALNNSPERLAQDKDYHVYGSLRAALSTVTLLTLSEAAPLLRGLESYLANDDDHELLRSATREALRAIGETPTAGYGVLLYQYKYEGVFLSPDRDRPYNALVPTELRTANAPKIAAGMSVKELTDLIGCPDARLFDQGHCFDYDIDHAEPYTLRVYLDNNQATVTQIKTISPFAFLHDPSRMRGY